jgi:hypothetical protein
MFSDYSAHLSRSVTRIQMRTVFANATRYETNDAGKKFNCFSMLTSNLPSYFFDGLALALFGVLMDFFIDLSASTNAFATIGDFKRRVHLIVPLVPNNMFLVVCSPVTKT